MPRNSSGIHSLPAGNPVTNGDDLVDTLWNNTFNDISDALTGSLPRDGSAPMTNPLKLPDGSAGAPTLTFNADTNTGFYRISADVIGVAVNGVKVGEFNSTGFVPATVLDKASFYTDILAAEDTGSQISLLAPGRSFTETYKSRSALAPDSSGIINPNRAGTYKISSTAYASFLVGAGQVGLFAMLLTAPIAKSMIYTFVPNYNVGSSSATCHGELVLNLTSGQSIKPVFSVQNLGGGDFSSGWVTFTIEQIA